jgi:hypothetical protein
MKEPPDSLSPEALSSAPIDIKDSEAPHPLFENILNSEDTAS